MTVNSMGHDFLCNIFILNWPGKEGFPKFKIFSNFEIKSLQTGYYNQDFSQEK